MIPKAVGTNFLPACTCNLNKREYQNWGKQDKIIRKKEEFMFLLELVKNENPPFLTGINNNVPEHSCAHRCC